MTRAYDRLTTSERQFVDDTIREKVAEARGLLAMGFHATPILAGDDRCERFADAFATWIIESRPAVATAT